MLKRRTDIPSHVLQFASYLRGQGLKVTTDAQVDVLHALSFSIPLSFSGFKNVLRSLLIKDRKDLIKYDELYDHYWSHLAHAENSKEKEQLKQSAYGGKKNLSPLDHLQALKSWLNKGEATEEKEMATYSAIEVLGTKDFSSYRSDDYKELLHLLRSIARRVSLHASRSYSSSRKMDKVDIRSTIRKSVTQGMDIQRIEYKKKKKKKARLVVFCDVSQSMELYSKFMIEFLYAFTRVVSKIETYAFSTQLQPLTGLLKDRSFSDALSSITQEDSGWGGGTRIGHSLDEFREKYGRRTLHKESMVIILSDGWDTGEASLLEENMRYLSKRSKALIWINPLAGSPAYKPETGAMKACLPYIDHFCSAHNLESLRQLGVDIMHGKWDNPYRQV